jgi:hypothetical protein
LVHCGGGFRGESVSWLFDSCKRNPVHDKVKMQSGTTLDSADSRFRG